MTSHRTATSLQSRPETSDVGSRALRGVSCSAENQVPLTGGLDGCFFFFVPG